MTEAAERELAGAQARMPLSNPYRRRRGEAAEAYAERLVPLARACYEAVGEAPPPESVLRELAQRAGKQRPAPRRLALHALAHLVKRPVGQVRGLIERERGPRRTPRSSRHKIRP